MNKTILFSPIGGTDPMSETNFHDGALIHIARHRKPDIIYMYMSKEILEKQAKDDRYRYCLNKLSQKIEHPFDIVQIERRDLVDVHKFEYFYPDFGNILHEITKNMDDSDELLLNISSGTPAMKSALLVLATMQDIRCKCVQVSTPGRTMNQQTHDKDGFFPEERWELNPDNDKKPGDEGYDRTEDVELPSLKKLKYEEAIKKYVSTYNYRAALTLAETLREDQTVSYLDKLRLADARQHLDFVKVDELVKNQDKEIYRPISAHGSRREVYEYTLELQANARRGQFADFARALSPAFVDLYEDVLRKQANLSIEDYTVKRNNMVMWDLDRDTTGEISRILNAAFHGNFRSGWVQSSHLIALIDGFIQDPEILQCMDSLRSVEEFVRNMAAHNMVSVSDEWIKAKTGFTSGEVIALIRQAFGYTTYNIRPELWESYDRMNEDIIRALGMQTQ